MTLIQLVVLAVVQGLTEFLPVSSSAHLILASWLMEWRDQGLVTDVAIHFGTLFAVVLYFRAELARMASAVLRPNGSEACRSDRKLAGSLLLASVPVILVGGLAHGWVETYLRDVRIIAVTTVVFGLLLWLADVVSSRQRGLANMTPGFALLIGLSQVLALVPGTSRSGVTLTMARFLGFDAESAARFSFLLSIPVIAAAGSYGILKVVTGESSLDWTGFGVAMVLSALAGWVCIAAFLALLRRVGLLPFVIYRLLLGLVLIIISF